MPYSKDWIAYMNAWADGPFVFKLTMEYSETGITGDVKEITHTFDTSGRRVVREGAQTIAGLRRREGPSKRPLVRGWTWGFYCPCPET